MTTSQEDRQGKGRINLVSCGALRSNGMTDLHIDRKLFSIVDVNGSPVSSSIIHEVGVPTTSRKTRIMAHITMLS